MLKGSTVPASPEANSIRLYKGYNLLLIFLLFLVYRTLWLEIIITQICSTFDERKKVHQHYCTVGGGFIFTLGRIVGAKETEPTNGICDKQSTIWIGFANGLSDFWIIYKMMVDFKFLQFNL
jgi:hypothetical protein